ncbi:hypothetical protein [Leptospira gomenensis]|nr:hypothetical protein [Leptospira gomenensis]
MNIPKAVFNNLTEAESATRRNTALRVSTDRLRRDAAGEIVGR